MAIHLLIVLIFLLTMPTSLTNVQIPLMTRQIPLLILPIPSIDHLHISTSQILHLYRIYWSQNQYCVDLMIFHLFFIFIIICVVFLFHSLHLTPPYQNPPPEIDLYSIPKTLAFVVLVFELQIPCICKV